MRIDLLLSRLCLQKTRSQAARACDEGRVWLNGQPARSSREVRPGDHVRYLDRLGRVEEEVVILAIPQGSVSRIAAREMYRVIERRLPETGATPPGRDGG
jgi:ribosomal 50S subunit-recycling heat shock protein